MAKKEWREVPESELTEEEVRRWFNRLRELYKEAMWRLHERKIERKKMNVMLIELKHERYVLRKENKKLKRLIEDSNNEPNKAGRKPKKVKDEPVNDFKKKFFDSL